MNIGLNLNNYSQYQNSMAYNTGLANQLNGSNIAIGNSAGNYFGNAAGVLEIGTSNKTGEVQCQTCASRKYVDRSNDPSVSFKTPTHVSPQASGAAVMSHEMEHVSRESAKANTEGREIVSQSVQIYTDTCPECGKVYTSGGKTTTTTRTDNSGADYFMDKMKQFFEGKNGKFIDVKI